tara:strand:- start:1278 stop:2915 length:1638 start_codon:yes stop_codon:yes gene_type:complete
MIKLKFISDQQDIYFEKNTIYITFSKTTYLKNQEGSDLIYFFDIPHNTNEKEINSCIERNLFFESKVSFNEFYPLTFKYIYKYFLAYTQFYNRLESLIFKYKEISHIEYSNNISFIFNYAVSVICERYEKINVPLNEEFHGFSYRHNDEMLSDIPFIIDNNNFYILLYALYLRIINHKVFILPSSFIANIPKHTNILKSSIFTIHKRFKRLLGLAGSSKYPLGLTRLKFSKNCKKSRRVDKTIWKDYREDERDIIEQLINTFFNQFSHNYLNNLKLKIQKFLRWSNTKCVILDETIDAYRRLILSACEDEKVEVEYMPHGIISEQLQFSYTENKDYNDQYIPKTLAWNIYSSQHLERMKLKSHPISFPINISPHKENDSRDILVLLSHGDRINLNQFEEDIIKILSVINYKKNKIDWKIHHNIFNDSNNIMNMQKRNIESQFDIKLNFIDYTIKPSSIMKNYNLLIFTTFTTGIYEASLLNVPFIIYSNANEECHGINVESIPIAKNDDDFKNLMKQENNDYLSEIKKSLTENISLNKYLTKKYA